MTKPPESLHERLNRELWRDRLGGWKMWAVMLPVIALIVGYLIPQPVDVSHRTGTVTGVTTLVTESGPKLRIGVDLGGTRVEAGTRARLIAPDNGEVICLRHTVGRWTGLESFNQTDMRFCDGSIPTSPVE